MKSENKESFGFKIGFSIEKLILISLIISNILDFTGFLTEELDYAKKIISWTGLLVLLKASKLSNIFFGIKDKKYDIFFPVSLFILSFKDFVSFGMLAHHEFKGILKHFFEFMYIYRIQIEEFSIYFGTALMIFWSIYIIFKNKEIGEKDSVYKLIKKKYTELHVVKFVKVLIIQFLFYIAFFSMFIEWLAISVDSSIFVLVFLIYIIYRKKIKEGAINSLTSLAEEFYEKVIKLFKYKNGLNFGIILMFLLHLLTDIGIFILPFAMYVSNPLYIERLDHNLHVNLSEIFFHNFEIYGFGYSLLALLIHFISVIFIAQLLIYPLIIFISRLKNQKIEMNNFNISLFFSSMIGFLSYPLISFQAVSKNFVGVNFIHQLQDLNFSHVFFSISLFIISFVFIKIILDKNYNDKIKYFFNSVIEIVSIIFLFYYFYLYIYSYLNYLILSGEYSLIRFVFRNYSMFTHGEFLLFLHSFFYIISKIILYILCLFLFVKDVFLIQPTNKNENKFSNRSSNRLSNKSLNKSLNKFSNKSIKK